MLVLIPRLIKQLNRFYQRNSKRISRFKIPSYFISALFILTIAPLGGLISPHSSYATTVALDTNSPFVFTSPEKTINIPVGRSRAELDALGMIHDPDEIRVIIQETAPKYGVDWRLVYAIGYLESGNYNSSLARRQNNFFGRKASSGTYASWPNTTAAIENQCEYLRTRYLDRGMDTPYEMNHVYAESGTWGAKVTGIMNSL